MNEQQIVNNLLNGVKFPVSWRYKMHLLVNVQNEETRNSFKPSMLAKLQNCESNDAINFLDRVLDNDYDGPAVYRNQAEEMQIENRSMQREIAILSNAIKSPDFSVNASAQTNKLLFWNAIQSYKREKRLNSTKDHPKKFYVERSQLHIVLDEWHVARVLAKKAKDIELMAVLNYSFGSFDTVCSFFEKILLLIESHELSIVSSFEMLHIITISLLCRYSFTEEDYLLMQLMRMLNDRNYVELSDALQSFMNGDYVNALSFIDSIEPIAQLSIYMCYSFEDAKKNIKMNAIIHNLFPYSVISLDRISIDVGLDQNETEQLLEEMIDKNRICAKIDYVSNQFIRGNKELQNYQKINDALERSTIIRLKAQEGIWRAKNFGSKASMSKPYRTQSVK